MAEFEFDATEDKSEDDVGGGQWLAPGRYHVVVQSVDDTFSKKDCVLVEMVALAGTMPNQVGRIVREKFFMTEKAKPRRKRFVMAAGLLRPGEKKSIDFKQAEGRQLVVEVEEEEYEGKDDAKIHRVSKVSYVGMWSVGNAAVADVPKDAKALALMPKDNGGGAAPVANSPSPPAPASAYSDI